MLSNAAIGGGLVTAHVVALVLHLNPAHSLAPGALLALAAALGAAYGTLAMTAFLTGLLVRQLFADEPLSPGWVSVRVLSWCGTLAASGAALVFWWHLDGYGPFLADDAVRRLTLATATLAASALAFLMLAVLHIGRRGGRMSATVLVVTMATAVAVPVTVRGPAVPPPVVPANPPVPRAVDATAPGRVVLVALDGASLDAIALAVAGGSLPNFGRLLDRGSSMHLATVRPTQAVPAWVSTATGKLPGQTGIRSASRYRAPGGEAIEVLPDLLFAQALVVAHLLDEERLGPEAMMAKPFWQIAADAGFSPGVIGWPLTHPARATRGYVVSEEYHRLEMPRLMVEGDVAIAVAPPAVATRLRDTPPLDATVPASGVVARLEDMAGDVDPRPDPYPVRADRMHLAVLRLLEAAHPSDVAAIRLPGLDVVGHYYLRYAQPDAFGDVSAEEVQRFGRVLTEYYAMLDGALGRLMAQQRPGDLLLVVSGYGMEPLSPGKRVLERVAGNPRLSGTHERAPDGFLLAYGSTVAPGRRPAGTLADVTPTLLYYLGLPIGRDMDGAARTDLFTPAFTDDRPVTVIPTYGR